MGTYEFKEFPKWATHPVSGEQKMVYSPEEETAFYPKEPSPEPSAPPLETNPLPPKKGSQ